jgi:hypothetical protein
VLHPFDSTIQPINEHASKPVGDRRGRGRGRASGRLRDSLKVTLRRSSHTVAVVLRTAAHPLRQGPRQTAGLLTAVPVALPPGTRTGPWTFGGQQMHAEMHEGPSRAR